MRGWHKTRYHKNIIIFLYYFKQKLSQISKSSLQHYFIVLNYMTLNKQSSLTVTQEYKQNKKYRMHMH